MLWAAGTWWLVTGIASIDTVDNERPGPLNGYGVTAVLVLGALAMLWSGTELVRREPRRRPLSTALVSGLNALICVPCLWVAVSAGEGDTRAVAGFIAVAAAAMLALSVKVRSSQM